MGGWLWVLLIGFGIVALAAGFVLLRAVNKSIDIILDEGFEAWERYWFSS
jgi:hypothetical protein